MSKNSCNFLPQNLQQLQPGGLAVKSQDNDDRWIVLPSCFYQGAEKEKTSFVFCLLSHMSLMATFSYNLTVTVSVNVCPAVDTFLTV